MTTGMDVGIDLGTATTLVYLDGKIVLKEPSVVAIHTKDNSILAVGREAYNMLGRTPDSIRAEFPMSGGVIAEYEVTERMIKYFLHQIRATLVVKPRVAICVPSGVTEVESRAVVDAAVSAGARRVYLIEEPVAAALGAGIDIAKPHGSMIVDIGGGTTDIAVLSLNGIVTKESIKTAGGSFDDAIVRAVRQNHNMLIGGRTAEAIKKEIGSVYPVGDGAEMEVKGRNLVTGLPRRFTVSREEIYEALIEYAMEIVTAMQSVLERTPPELVGDILESGITMTGGGALLRGMDKLISKHIKAPAYIAERPDECVAIGTGLAFRSIPELADGFANMRTHQHG